MVINSSDNSVTRLVPTINAVVTTVGPYQSIPGGIQRAATSTPCPTATKTPLPTATKTPRPTTVPTKYFVIPQYLSLGKTFAFGHYEQDNNYSNGQEPIYWKVLRTTGNEAMIITQNIIDAAQYHSRKTFVTWESCDLRKWLNNSFYNTAFSREEQQYILNVRVINQDNRKTEGVGGNDTYDRIYLLDTDEAKQYLTESDRMCVATNYAKARGAYWSANYPSSWWWLRSPGQDNTWAADVGASGGIYPNGTPVNYNGDNGLGGIRPVMWVRLR